MPSVAAPRSRPARPPCRSSPHGGSFRRSPTSGARPGAAALRAGGRVVVARVVAPVPPSPADGGDRPRAAAAIGRTTRESLTTGSDGDAGGSIGRGTFDEPAVVASVSRLTAPPASPSASGDAAWHPAQRNAGRRRARRRTGPPGTAPATARRRCSACRACRRWASSHSTYRTSPTSPTSPTYRTSASSGRAPRRPHGRPPRTRRRGRLRRRGRGRRTPCGTRRTSSRTPRRPVRPPHPPTPAAPAAGENVEQLVRKLYGPIVRRIKAELLLDRERRGIRIDGI